MSSGITIRDGALVLNTAAIPALYWYFSKKMNEMSDKIIEMEAKVQSLERQTADIPARVEICKKSIDSLNALRKEDRKINDKRVDNLIQSLATADVLGADVARELSPKPASSQVLSPPGSSQYLMDSLSRLR